MGGGRCLPGDPCFEAEEEARREEARKKEEEKRRKEEEAQSPEGRCSKGCGNDRTCYNLCMAGAEREKSPQRESPVVNPIYDPVYPVYDPRDYLAQLEKMKELEKLQQLQQQKECKEPPLTGCDVCRLVGQTPGSYEFCMITKGCYGSPPPGESCPPGTVRTGRGICVSPERLTEEDKKWFKEFGIRTGEGAIDLFFQLKFPSLNIGIITKKVESAPLNK